MTGRRNLRIVGALLGSFAFVFAAVAETGTPFSHDLHAVDNEIDCSSCHMDADAGRLLPVSRDGCADCHEGEHLPDLPIFSGGAPSSHRGDFLFTHRLDAVGPDAADCAGCHVDEESCTECHLGENVETLSHPRNFLFTHADEARGGFTDCGACHDERSFCLDCHAGSGVRPPDHRSLDWVNPGLPDGGLHSDEGRADIAYCATCHTDAEPTCTLCH